MPSKHTQKSSHPVSTPSAPAISPLQHSFIINSSIPYHFVNNCSLFTTFTSAHQVFHTSFRTDVAIEGHETVDLYFVAFGQLHASCLTCMFAPSIPNLFSSLHTMKCSNQVMLSTCSPRLLVSAKHRQSRPTLPKYFPLVQDVNHLLLPFHPVG